MNKKKQRNEIRVRDQIDHFEGGIRSIEEDLENRK
jgi:hypothetical protein